MAKIQGLDALSRKLKTLPKRVQNKVQVGVSSRLKKLKSERNRQKAKERNKYRPASYGAYYWRFIEFGTSKMPAKPFIRPTFDAKKTGIAKRIIVELEKGVETEASKL